jgi:hypothetical protein
MILYFFLPTLFCRRSLLLIQFILGKLFDLTDRLGFKCFIMSIDLLIIPYFIFVSHKIVPCFLILAEMTPCRGNSAHDLSVGPLRMFFLKYLSVLMAVEQVSTLRLSYLILVTGTTFVIIVLIWLINNRRGALLRNNSLSVRRYRSGSGDIVEESFGRGVILFEFLGLLFDFTVTLVVHVSRMLIGFCG